LTAGHQRHLASSQEQRQQHQLSAKLIQQVEVTIISNFLVKYFADFCSSLLIIVYFNV